MRYMIIGGDLRQYHLAKLLEADCSHSFATVCTLNVPNTADSKQPLLDISKSDIVILPTPVTKDQTFISGTTIELKTFPSLLSSHQVVFGGCFSEAFQNACKATGCVLCDITDSQSYSLFNSIATAEGAIAEALTMSPGNLHDSSCLILGAGKCGRALSTRLKGLNAHPTVCARTVLARTEAIVLGMNAVDFSELPEIIHSFSFIFNTVPAMVLPASLLEHVQHDCTIVDLASRPGGTDFSYCNLHNIRAKLCPGLPGIYSPYSSALAILSEIQTYPISSS